VMHNVHIVKLVALVFVARKLDIANINRTTQWTFLKSKYISIAKMFKRLCPVSSFLAELTSCSAVDTIDTQ